jgi:HD-GYP domain-containing protein (c-di-GMP phosphodiesterase class II)
MVIAKAIYGLRGVLILREGRALGARHIEALTELGYPGIYIHDLISDGIELEEIVDEQTRHNAISMVKNLYKAGELTTTRTQIMHREMEDLINEIVSSIFESDAAVVNVPLLKSYDEYTYRHSVDVGVLSVALGKSMGFTREKLLDLGKAAFFHDMGKMFIPQTILNKADKLTEDEFVIMKKHSQMGHDFVEKVLLQKSSIMRGVLHHHERFDGSGYPHGLKGVMIPQFARIIAAADVFDAISSTRPYKVAQLATEGYEYILGNSGSHFDPEIVDIFYKTIAPFPVGMTVKLSNGLNGVVVKNNANFMSRPLVRAFEPENPSVFEMIDLSKGAAALDITIVGN